MVSSRADEIENLYMRVCMYIVFEKELLSCSFAHRHGRVSRGFDWLVLGRWFRDDDVFR